MCGKIINMKKDRLGFDIQIMGMIASGKDTQAKILKDKYNLEEIETGNYTRKLLKEKSENGDIARKYSSKGNPLPVFLMKEFLKNKISKRPKNKDLIFIGGPRLKPEAQLVNKLLKENKQKLFVIYISLPDKEVYKRSLFRKNSNIEDIYKVFDTKEIIKRRISWHKDQVGKTVKYFESLGILKKVNGNQPIEKVHEDIEKALEYFKKINNTTLYLN